jgi:hypothetical protein
LAATVTSSSNIKGQQLKSNNGTTIHTTLSSWSELFYFYKNLNIMLTDINPKLPMRDKSVTREFYINKLSFQQIGNDYDGYLMVQKDNIQIHFFDFKELDPKENYGQVYIRTDDIASFYQSILDNKFCIHPAGQLQTKPWGQKEFAILDPDNNLLTFGQSL